MLVVIGLVTLWWLVLIADLASIAAAALGGIALWLIHRVVAHAGLSARATRWATIAVFGTALVGAAVGGAQMNRGGTTVVVRSPGTTIKGWSREEGIRMPDFRGLPVGEAVESAVASGLQPSVAAASPGPPDIVVGQSPPPGTYSARAVILYVGPAASSGTGTLPAAAGTTVPAASAPRPTTSTSTIAMASSTSVAAPEASTTSATTAP